MLYGNCDCSYNKRCCDPDECTSGARSDGYRGCYLDSCEMINGPCDCENGRTVCCFPGQRTTITTKFAITAWRWLWTTTRRTTSSPPDAHSDGC